MSVRDHARELQFLLADAQGGRDVPRVADVVRRFHAGRPLYSGSQTVGPDTLLGELGKEPATLGAWATLAQQALDGLGNDLGRRCVARALHAVAPHRGEAHAEICTVGRALDLQDAGPRATAP